jgi:glutamine synthetase adenylyltransferase
VSIDATMAALSNLAAGVFDAAMAIEEAEDLAVIGVGKFEANELNFVSDVDVLFVGEGDPVELDRHARHVMRTASQCFIVDVDLLPEGRDGPLVRTVESYGVTATWAERVAAALFRHIGGVAPASRIMAVDPDLRPEGRTGPLARWPAASIPTSSEACLTSSSPCSFFSGARASDSRRLWRLWTSWRSSRSSTNPVPQQACSFARDHGR